MMREKEDWRKQQVDIHFTMTDRALVEEASRYGSVLNSWGLRVSRPSPSNSFSFGRTPEGEYYDHSGVLRRIFKKENCQVSQSQTGPLRMAMVVGTWLRLIVSAIRQGIRSGV